MTESEFVLPSEAVLPGVSWPALVGGGILALVLIGIVLLALLTWIYPHGALRLLVGVPSLLYKVHVFGRHNMPGKGPALLVCSQAGFIDAFLILLSHCFRIRFVVWEHYTEVRGLGFLLRLARAIPIDPQGTAREAARSLRLVRRALRAGDIVCAFLHSSKATAGRGLTFHRALRHILKRTSAPVIPVALDVIWGDIFCFRDKKLSWRWPQRVPYPVSLAFGNPLSSDTDVLTVIQSIHLVSAEAAIARKDLRTPVHRQFVRQAARHPFRLCVIDALNQGKVFRYGQVLAAVWILARKLRPILGDEAKVGLWLPPSAGGAFANISLAILGKTSVNLNYSASTEVVQSCVRQCDLKHILTSRLFLSKVPLDAGPGVELVFLEDFRKSVSALERVLKFLTVVLSPAWMMEKWWLGLGKHQNDDLATIIFSSGSTGDPKGIMLTHGNLAANAESTVQAIDPRPSDRLLCVLPFFHSFGYTVTLWLPLQVGASMVYYPDPRQAKEIGELCRKFRCTIYLTTPTLLRFCQKRCSLDDFRSVRILMVGAEKLPVSLAQEFKERFSVLPLEGYGCTELSPVATANVNDWLEGGVTHVGNRPGAIGRPLPGIAAKIVHPETYAPLPARAEGMLMIYGANVMKGYLGRPEATREAIRDGWYVTGDIARYEEDGFITITDRLARFSKIGGEMVPHQRIEDELHRIIGTTERVCVVTAVADERKGERLVVLHTPVDGMSRSQLWHSLNSRGLPNLWVPAERDFVQVAEMPLLGSGKVDLKRIKEMAQESVHKRG